MTKISLSQSFITPEFGFWAVILALGIIWVKSGIEKIQTGNFPQTLGKTLQFFAQGAPGSATSAGNPYPWFRDYLLHVAVPQSQLLGQLVQWGELLAGLAFIAVFVVNVFFPQFAKMLSPLFILAFLGAFAMNLMFWLGGGWTSPSTDTVNLFMMAVEVVGVVVLVAKWI